MKIIAQLFADKLPQNMRELEEEFDQLSALLPEKLELENFQRRVHTLAGTAGSFGFSPLGDKAKELELLIIQLRDEPDTTQYLVAWK